MLARGYDPLFYLRGTPTTLSATAYHDKLAATWNTLSGYASEPGALVLAASILVLLLRGKWFLPLCLLAPLLVLSVSSRQDSRHLYAPMAVLLLCGASAVEAASTRFRDTVYPFAFAVALAWGAVVWLPVARTMVFHPADLPLTSNDRDEYILSESSGFALDETLVRLQERHAERVIGILANCLSLRYLSGSTVIVDCPRLNPNGDDRAALVDLMENSRQDGVYVVLEAIPYAPSSAPGTEVATIEFLPGRPRLTIYDLSPQS